ncbi:deaminase [Spiroplasma endosymbiont of Aspidapion aeneum]|uniref:deaminase n=1 Tax=Spiroplasma endosymbiont of Aspidapion aeneum TaxID=3066276 RepID=UPI00313C2BC5
MSNNHLKIIKKLIEKCKRKGEVPVVALIYNIKHQEKIFYSYNTRQKKYTICGHAEINLINKMFKKTKSKNLINFEMIVTLIPCEMCYFAIKQVSIKNIYYILDNDKTITKDIEQTTPKLIKIKSEYSEQYKKELSNFFKKMR